MFKTCPYHIDKDGSQVFCYWDCMAYSDNKCLRMAHEPVDGITAMLDNLTGLMNKKMLRRENYDPGSPPPLGRSEDKLTLPKNCFINENKLKPPKSYTLNPDDPKYSITPPISKWIIILSGTVCALIIIILILSTR